ncbi:DE-cadherin isoform X1 [Monomorium pharaonis]|uniref:DE-cadherin isoform X1 n=1 Tax=Monomorium pharaonis TaxID=307658 RepID=UPI00063FD2A0|nr:DE-cadherin isoform X1 [Monomorium pharaonis]XP_028047796.1 DE-cadherin isoform X1 [Monomorium pharaonis]
MMLGKCVVWRRSGARPRRPLAAFVPLLLLCCGTFASGTRLRHSRHLDVRSQFLAEGELSLDENHNHKPVFSNCSNYAPVVKEEEPIGTVVIQVHAEDRDPPGEGGTITYSFVTAPDEKLKFAIDNTTGLIKTLQVLDRDEPAREKEFYLTVLATDNGRPQLDDVCTFKVTIEDVNDNPPAFDKVVYHRGYVWKAYTESVPQDLPVGREVMRVSAADIDDGNNSVVRYTLASKKTDDAAYFRIDSESGVIFLNKAIDRTPDYKFSMTATARDLGENSQPVPIDLTIRVVESHKKAPAFLPRSSEPIRLQENFSDFDASIVRLKAVSNIDNSSSSDNSYLLFELVVGRTEQTNRKNTFRLESNKDIADIKLSQHLDYESNTQYSLIVRVQNKYQLAAETVVDVEVLDVNDNIPVFRDIKRGSVLENEPRGAPVMQVRAIDADGTSVNNQVSYELDNFKDLFAIDPQTGNITTLVTFDREVEDIYNVKIIATDNSPSALFKTGEHNKGEQVFQIEIADKNDNPPRFTKKVYTDNSVLEDININAPVTEVKAIDSDTASPVTYSIIAGNKNNSFYIEATTGKIRVNKPLDYEKITKYNLTVRAFDGVFNDTAEVEIFVENVNDNPPIFKDFNTNPTIQEERLVEGCVTVVSAYDPDIEDRNADQHIVYSIVKEEQQPYISVENTGCMKLKKPLDRDPPQGHAMWTFLVMARDEDGSPTALQKLAMINITLLDINDNAPFLDMPYPVIWGENKGPGRITELKARDYDSEENGPPFEFRIDDSADNEIRTKFDIRETYLFARVMFDREFRKSYDIPIAITDSGSPPMTGTSTLTVIIGDENDNPMREGSSSIFVYNYKGESPDTEIGRVFVNDPDDWDLPDKSFDWASPHDGFYLNTSTGMITLLSGTSNDTFVLKFIVTEKGQHIPSHQVYAYVNVTVKELPEEAVERSGSIRFQGITPEEFVEPDESGVSKKEIFQEKVATMLNTSVENVDVFTVLHSDHHKDKNWLDVRFSAHGSPYYASEKLNTIIAQHSKEIEREMKADILLMNIDECLFEKLHCNNSCRNFLNVSTVPYAIYTNTSSFVGVRAVVDPLCTCHVAEPIVCLNGGTPLAERCECPPGLEGPRCELLGIGFNGDGWAIMPPPGQACDDSHLGLEITPHVDNGLVFYFGPMTYNPKFGIQDFMSLELQQGYAVLYIDYGTGTVRLDQKQIKLTDGKSHRIDIYWKKTSIEMIVDKCGISACMSLTAPQGTNEFLNVNSPIQIGGTLTNLAHLASNLGWDYKPTDKGFVGCIRNMTFNGNTYNLGMPSLSRNADPGCDHGMAKAISFGIDTNFIVAILVCVLILLILLVAVVVHRRKTDDLYKDMDDIRENIINYEDEGGGEGDVQSFDLNVLRAIYDAPPIDSKIAPIGLQGRGTDEVPDICGFLDGKKESCDKDPDTNPYDDLRHYAYEGEGNSEGDLSSLASCTDDGDLKFNYLSNFGPRFRKLADMYGEDPSDEESDGVGERESESWC